MSAAPFLDEILVRARRGMGKTSVGGASRPRGERVWRSLTSTGSAFVKRIPGAGVQHTKQLAGQMAYVNGKAKGIFGFATGLTTEGDAFEQADLDGVMAAWSQDWKGRPRNGHTSHMVLSFPEDVSKDAAFMIAQQWCAEMFESETHAPDAWEYVAALHTDTVNPHVHVILNNRGTNGTWFSISSEGVFNPQMLRDRMTDIGDEYGVRLESLTRADRGLYRDPITSAEVFAAREGRVLSTEAEKEKLSANWRREDMMRTAEIYATLADFAETIGAPQIAERAFISANALFAGQEVPKGLTMDIDIDVTADREDIRTSLIGWAEQNAAQIEALPPAQRTEIMGKIDAALTIIETDVAPDLTEDTVWTAFKETPSSYLVPDVGALEARAALYVPEDKADLLHEFVRENVLDTYLVTGEVPSRFAAVMPAVADAYEEMHSHRLEEIPKEMKAYVQRGAAMGLDPVVLQERLIHAIVDPAENVRMERDDIAKIVAARGLSPAETAAVVPLEREIDMLIDEEPNRGFSAADAGHMQTAWKTVQQELRSREREIGEDGTELRPEQRTAAAYERIKEEQVRFLEQHREIVASPDRVYDEPDAFTFQVTDREAFDRIGQEAAAIMERARPGMKVADAVAAEFKDRYPDMPDHLASGLGQTYATVEEARHTEAINAVRDRSVDLTREATTPDITTQAGLTAARGNAYLAAYSKAASDYRDFQLDLGKVEEKIIAESRVYDRDGVARVLQDAASTAATTGRADFADSAVGREALTAFVALEGRGAMQELASGNMDALSEYVDTPAHQRLAAKELLKSAKSLDVGLAPDAIETGLEAVDPMYSRGRGYSI